MIAGRHAFGQVVALAALALMAAYALVTAAGFAALRAPDQPIPDPYFTVMEALILALAPVLILVMIVIHAWAAPARWLGCAGCSWPAVCCRPLDYLGWCCRT